MPRELVHVSLQRDRTGSPVFVARDEVRNEIPRAIGRFVVVGGARLRWKKFASAYGAGIVVAKPCGNAVRSDEVGTGKADQTFDDTRYRR